MADLALDHVYQPNELRNHQSSSYVEDGLASEKEEISKVSEPGVNADQETPAEPEDDLQEQFWALTIEETNTQENELPPLSKGGARIVVIENEDGQHIPAMVLTTQMIREWNIILKWKRRASEYRSKMFRLKNEFDKLENQKRELKEKKTQLREKHKNLSVEEFAILESIIQLRANYQKLVPPANELLQQFNIYKEKFEYAEEAPKQTRSWMEKYWGFLMAENNLLEPFDDSGGNSNDSFVERPNHTPISYEHPEPTPSELARQELYVQLQEKREKIVELEEIVNNWQKYYNDELVEYLAAVKDGTCHNSRTVFDLCLLEESQEKIRELIQIEKEYGLGLVEARNLGMGMEDDSTVSYTPSSADDGYTLSFENEILSSIDKRWIRAWMDEIEDEDPSMEPECDDWNEWEVKSIAQNERDSVVYDMMARGKMRKKIDQWRSMCDAVRFPGIVVPTRIPSKQSIDSSDFPSAESSPFITTPPISPTFRSGLSGTDSDQTPLQSPSSPEVSSSQSSLFIKTSIAPTAFGSYELGIRQTQRESQLGISEEAISPFSTVWRHQEENQDYGPFSPVDIQEDLY